MRLVERTESTPEENLAFDEAALLAAEAGESGEMLRLWEWPTPAVVLGAGGSIAIDVDEAACLAEGVPILRRPSGGGTVLLGRGCLLFSLVLSYERDPALRDVNASYRWILGRIRDALAAVGSVELAGISDLAHRGRKFSGNAQQRKSRHLLHHGTMLYDFEVSWLARYLRTPEREPAYRERRTHHEFVGNLPATREQICESLHLAFAAEPDEAPPAVVDRVPALTAERYRDQSWIRRR